MRLWVTLLLSSCSLLLDGSSTAARGDPLPRSSGNPALAFRRERSDGSLSTTPVKEPSPFHFPPRSPKNPQAISFLPGHPPALNNGRDFMPGPSQGGVALSFGTNGRVAGGPATSEAGSSRDSGAPPVTGENIPAPADPSESSTSSSGSSSSSSSSSSHSPIGLYKTRSAPNCNNGSTTLPCERDDEYTDEIAERVRSLIYASTLNNIIEDGTFSQFLNDTAVMDPGKDVGGVLRGGFIVESPACRAQESIIYPQRAKTATDDWVFVVNQDSVKQGVRVEKCLREGEQCHFGAELPPTISTTCRQKFIYRKLLVLGEAGTTIQPESVLLPSCCVCYISNSDQLISGRMRNQTSVPAPPAPGQSVNFDGNA